jgi:tetrahydromethanopterin S-methyltransferase subunit F
VGSRVRNHKSGLTPWKVFARTGVRAQRDLVTKITYARESKGGEVNRGIIGVIIGVLVIIILVIVILQLT